MKLFKDLRLLAISVMLAITISATFASPAFADDSVPPEPPVTEIAPPQDDDQKVVTIEPPTLATQITFAEDNEQEEITLELPATPIPHELAENILAEVPQDTNVVVVNDEGNALPLASQEAEEILYEGDPMWCPTGVSPKPNAGGCSGSFGTFGNSTTVGSLLEWMDTHDQAKAGTIWVAFDYSSAAEPTVGNNVTINGLDFTNFQKVALTIQGGWNGVSGPALNTATPYSNFNSVLSILNWLAPVTINDVRVTGILEAQSTKNIIVNRVQVINNGVSGVYGASFDTIAAPLGAPASVTVNDSVFNGHLSTGLQITADGPVTLKNVIANYNGTGSNGEEEYGVYINNSWDNPNQPVTLSGTNEFKGNLGTGLGIFSFGAITLNNITASYNNDGIYNGYGHGWGVYIDNHNDSTPSNVKLTGTNLITFNLLDGLWIISNGDVNISNLTSSFNFGSGATIVNCINAIGCVRGNKSVTLTGTNNFNGNSASGLQVAAGNAILLSNITVNNNAGGGLSLDNCADEGSGCIVSSIAPVTITGFVTTNNNGGIGLSIYSYGAITLNNVTSNYNYNDSWGWGVYIVNNYNLLKPQNVTLNGTNSFSYNSGTGLQIYTYGAVKTNNITANNNGGMFDGNGVYIDNLGYNTGPGGSVLITRKPVTMTGFNTFLANDDSGLVVYTLGTVSINNLTSSFNGTDGAFISNQYDWFPNFSVTPTNFVAPITITGFVDLSNNGEDGLDLQSHGAVSLKNVTANNNGDDGVSIDAQGLMAPQSVTLSGYNNFMSNGFASGDGNGLIIYGDGLISISNLIASANRNYGAFLNNYTYSLTGKYLGVTLTGFSTFQGNQGASASGLYIATDGIVTLNHINADRNANNGVEVHATKNISITCGSAFSNGGTGFYLSGAVLTLKGLQSYLNGTNENLIYTNLIPLRCP